MNRFKVRIGNIINKFQKKSIDNFQNIKGFFINRAKKLLNIFKQFFWILKVILTYKPEKKQKKPKLLLRFPQPGFPQKITVNKNKKQPLRNLLIYCAWSNYKNQKITRKFFLKVKDSLTSFFGKLAGAIIQFFSGIIVFFTGARKNLQASIKQFLLIVKISFSWKAYKNHHKAKQFFYGVKDILVRLVLNLKNKVKLLFSGIADFFRSIKVFFAGFYKKITAKRKLSFPDFKKLSQNTVYFFLSIKEFFARKSFKYNIISAVKFFFIKQVKIFLYNTKQFFLFLKNLSARQTIRVDIFLIIIILFLIINPFIINNIGSTEVKAKQVNLFLSMNSEKLHGSDISKMLLEDFNRQNPDIRIYLHDGQASEAEREPDIFIFDESEYNSLFSAGKLADLSAYYIQEKTDLHESDEHHDEPSQPTAISAAASVQYALPLVSFMDMLFYNIEILSTAGFDHPPKTREDFIKCAGAVSRGNFPGMAGALLSLSADDHQALSRDIFSWLWAGGVNFWEESAEPRRGEGSRAAWDKPLLASSANMRAITSDFTFLAGIYREVQTHGIFNRTGSRSLEEFAQGKAALLIASASNIPYLRERMGDDKFGITTIPGSGTGGRYGISLSSIYAGINSSAPHTDEESQRAMSRFLKFLSEKTELFCEELKAIPGSVINPIPGKYVRNDPYYSKAWDIFEISRVVQSFSGKPGAEIYEAIFLEELRLFFEGEKNAQQTVVSIQRRWDDVRISD